eukprot:6192294-Pleurochrysis_carterae.AAC.2
MDGRENKGKGIENIRAARWAFNTRRPPAAKPCHNLGWPRQFTRQSPRRRCRCRRRVLRAPAPRRRRPS